MLVHRALGERTRLTIVDELLLNDRTPAELVETTGLASNLLAHHLDVLEQAGLISRHESEGDHRRRYVVLQQQVLGEATARLGFSPRRVLFVCTHNSARSQFAEAALRLRSDLEVSSAGPSPGRSVHPKAVQAAAELGVDLAGLRPKAYDQVALSQDLVISVCDRAREASTPFQGRRLHWSVPDPVGANRLDGFRSAFREIDQRINILVKWIHE